MPLDNITISALRGDALEAEQSGHLTDRQLVLMRSNNWFRLFVPKQIGGLGMTLPEALRVEEELAWIDGSVGWVITLCAGAGWFVGFADQGFAQSLLNDKNFCVAGSGAVGTADVVPGGFRINGSWKYASGSLHATVFTVNCRISGSGEVRSFFLLPNEVIVKHTWNSMGMVATGSHSFEVKDKVIGPERQFLISPEHAVLHDPIYQYPFLQLAETTLAVNLSGMARRFIELAKGTGASLDQYRDSLFQATDLSWETLSLENFASVSTASHALVKASRDIVNQLYPKCGLTAADKSTEINRVWRNFHTASQHALFA